MRRLSKGGLPHIAERHVGERQVLSLPGNQGRRHWGGGECARVMEGCSFGVQIPGPTALSPGSVERGGEWEPDFALAVPGTLMQAASHPRSAACTARREKSLRFQRGVQSPSLAEGLRAFTFPLFPFKTSTVHLENEDNANEYLLLRISGRTKGKVESTER